MGGRGLENATLVQWALLMRQELELVMRSAGYAARAGGVLPCRELLWAPCVHRSAACFHACTSAPASMKCWPSALLRVVTGLLPVGAQPAGCQLRGRAGLAYLPSLFLVCIGTEL